MTSATAEWFTPLEVLERVRRVGPIALDPCGAAGALVEAITDLRLDLGEDGLSLDWVSIAAGGLIYVNPPYWRGIIEWVKRCYAAGQLGGECIALLPARPDPEWFQAFCAPPFSDVVCFWRGRLTFLGAPNAAPFPSALVYWGPRPSRFADAFHDAGALWFRRPEV